MQEDYDMSQAQAPGWSGPSSTMGTTGARPSLAPSQLRSEQEVISRINELEREAEELLSPAKTVAMAAQILAQVPKEEREAWGIQAKIDKETAANEQARRLLNSQRSQIGSQITDLRIRARSLSSQSGSKDFNPDGTPIYGTAAWRRVNQEERDQQTFADRGEAARARDSRESRGWAALEYRKEADALVNERANYALQLRENNQDVTAGLKAYDAAINEAKANATQSYRQAQVEGRAYNDYYNKVLNMHRSDVTQHGQDITRYLGEERLATSERNKDVDKIAAFAEDMAKAAVKMAEKLVSPQQAAMMKKAVRDYGRKAGIAGMANWEIGEAGPEGQQATQAPTTAEDFALPGEAEPMFSGAPRPTEGVPRQAAPDDIMGRARDYSQDARFNPHLAYQQAARTAASALDETRPGWRNRTINDPGPGPVAPNIPVPIYTEQPGQISVNATGVANAAAAASPSRLPSPTPTADTTTAEYEALMDALRREGLYQPALDDGIGQAARDVLNGIGINEPGQFTPSMVGG